MKQRHRRKRELTNVEGMGYPELPAALDEDYNRKQVLTTLSILECDNGGKVITAMRTDPQRNTTYNIYQVRPDQELMDVIATVLVEARLK